MPAPPDQLDRAAAPRTWPCAAAAAALLLVQAVVHFVFLARDCPLDLSGDEAHYWEWSRRLDWSYYSKGPLVAYIIAAARAMLAQWSERLVGSEALAVRFPALLLSVGTGMGIFTLAQQTLGRPRQALAAVALTFTVPILAAGSFLMTIDAPLACLYVWTLVCVLRGLRSSQTWPWLVAGVLIALGILAKYTMVLIFPTVLLAMLLGPAFRSALHRPGPYLGALLGLTGFVPIAVWNMQHDWVGFRHVAGQAGVSGRTAFDPLGPLAMLAGQLAVVGPVWFTAMVWAVVSFMRRGAPRYEPGAPATGPASEPRAAATGPRSARPPTGGAAHDPNPVFAARTENPREPTTVFLLCATAIPWLVFLIFSPVTKIQPNWPVLALLPGLSLLVGWLVHLREPSRRLRSGLVGGRTANVLITAGVLFGGAGVGLLHVSETLMPLFGWLARHEPPWSLTPVAKYDPSARLRGWSQLGAAVGRALAAERATGRAPFIITDDYQVASQIAMYCPGEPTTFCLQAALGDRQSQYDLWRPNPIRDPAAFRGRPCIYVGALKPELTGQVPSRHVALRGARLAETVTHRVRGHAVAVWAVYACDEFTGLPLELGTGGTKY